MVSPDEMNAFLAKVPLFQGLNKRQTALLARRFIPRNFKAGEAIVTQGKGGEGMFTILSGRVEAIVETVDGEKSVVNSFGPTDFFGEVTMLDDGPRTASVVAVEDTECLVLTRSDFISLIQNDAEMATAIAVALAKRLRRAVGTL